MRKFLALVLALVMTMSLVTVSAGAATDFTDDASITNAEAVEVMSAIGILGGYPDGSFRPNASLTRGAGAKLVAYLMLGQAAADKLTATYTVFEDVDDTVVLAPYIEWAYAAGLVQGYGDGNFGPYNTLTEYAFGKMLLTAIGYDAAKAGYTGAGWQKAVYRDALASDIYNGTESFGACTRDTAARLCLATLETNYVVYGSADMGGWYEINGKWYKTAANVSVSGVYETDVPVWSTYEDLDFNGTAYDTWGNPGDEWTYDDEVIGFYEDAAVKTYTTKVDDCSVLVDLGIPVSSGKDAELRFIYNGNYNLGGNDKDGYYFYAGSFAQATAETFEHDSTHVNCDDKFIGGQGVLTKVFKNENDDIDADYLVTEVATYLAYVSDVSKDHAGYTTEFKIGYRVLEDYGRVSANHDLHTGVADTLNVYSLSTDAYAKKDYVLVTVNVTNPWEESDDALEIVDHELATSTEGKLTGAVPDKDAAPLASVTKVDKVSERDAFGFSDEYGYAKTKLASSQGTKYAFYYDNYGNVIGMVDISTTNSYLVVDAIWSNHDKNLDVYADVVALDATLTEKVDVAKLNGTAEKYLDENDDVEEDYRDNADVYAYYLYSFSETDGEYSLTLASVQTKDTYYYYGDISHAADDDDFYADRENMWVQMTNKTEVLMRDVNGNYTAVTGKNNVPALTATHAEIIFDTNGYAKIVFLNNVTFLEAKVVGFIVDTDSEAYELIDDEVYYEYDFYIGEEATKVYVALADQDLVTFYGLYEAQFDAVGGNLVVKGLKTDLDGYESYDDAKEATGKYDAGTVKVVTEDLVEVDFVGDDVAEDLDAITVYEVDISSSGTGLKKVDADSLKVGDRVHVILNEKGNAITTIYVIKG